MKRLAGTIGLMVALATICSALLGPRSTPVARAAGIPRGLPSHMGIGVAAPPSSNGIYGWMPNTNIPWDYAYQYLSGGVNTGGGWETWNSSGQFATYYAQGAASHNYIPVFSYYELLQSAGSCGSCGEQQKDLSNLNNSGLMASYFQNFRLLMQRLGSGTYGGIAGVGKTAVVQVEPDLSGYAQSAALNNSQCFGYCSGQGNDPANVRAAVASSGDTELQGYPNTFQGFNWALLHLRDLYAPNVLLGVHVSNWSTGNDIGGNSSPSLDAASLGQQAGTFAARSGISGVPAGTSSYDVLFNDVSDRDSGYYKYVYNNPNTWWDRTNTVFPNFHRWESYIGAASQAAGRSVIVWQIPLGNQYFATENNTNGHYQDNRTEYFFGHLSELAQSGVVGLLFGAGNGGSTTNTDSMNDGVTNPASICSTDGMVGSGQICNNHTSSSSDDDGGYLRLQAQQYFAGGGYPLGGSSSPTATSTATATAKSTPTSSPTSTATPKPSSSPTPTATSKPTASPTATATTVAGNAVVIGNFEGGTDGFAGNSDVTNMGPTSWPPSVALGSSSLWVPYNIPGAWSEAQLYKIANLDLTGRTSLSVSVLPNQPTAAGAGVKVRFQVQGSSGSWYSSAYRTVPIGTRSTVTWNISGVPRSPLRQLYVCWQFTTGATSTGNELWLDAIQAR